MPTRPTQCHWKSFAGTITTSEFSAPGMARTALDAGLATDHGLPPEVDTGEENVTAAAAAVAAEAAAPLSGSRRSLRKVFRWGNYPGYYGYRVGSLCEDHRLVALRPEWFHGRRCLDVGCNEGLIPLTLAVRFHTASVHGVEIDTGLVRKAGRNLRSLQRAASEAAAEAATLGVLDRLTDDKAALAAAVQPLQGVTFMCVFRPHDP